MTSPLSPALADALRSSRAEFNARFAAAKHANPNLDAAAFAHFLQNALDGLTRAVDQVRPDRVTAVVSAGFDIGLELVGQRLAGLSSRQPLIEQAWQRLLPRSAPLVAAAP